MKHDISHAFLFFDLGHLLSLLLTLYLEFLLGILKQLLVEFLLLLDVLISQFLAQFDLLVKHFSHLFDSVLVLGLLLSNLFLM